MIIYIIMLSFPLVFSLNYSIVLGVENHLTLPEYLYNSEEPLDMKLSVLTSEANHTELQNFCQFQSLDINLNNLKAFTNYNITKIINNDLNINKKVNETNTSEIKIDINAEFLIIKDYIYILDRDGYLKIHLLVNKEDLNTGKIEFQLVDENEIKLEVNINKFSRILMFGDTDLSHIYIFIDNILYIYSIFVDYKVPTLLNKETIYLEDNYEVNKIVYYEKNHCFFSLISNFTIDMHCLLENRTMKSVKNVFNSFFNEEIKPILTDLWIDQQEDIIYVSDYNIGVYFFNILENNNISLNYLFKHKKILVLKKYLQSLIIITHYNGSYGIDNYLEEYFCQINKERNVSSVGLRRRIRLGTSYPNIHLIRNYIINLQGNNLKLYRHSIPTGYQEFVSSINLEEILQIHNVETTSYNIFLAIFPNKISLYSIKTNQITFNCFPDIKKIIPATYLFKFLIKTPTCDLKQNSILTYSDYEMCKFEFEALVKVLEMEIEENNEEMIIIIGLLIIISFMMLLVILLFYCWRKVKRDYLKLSDDFKGKTMLHSITSASTNADRKFQQVPTNSENEINFMMKSVNSDVESFNNNLMMTPKNSEKNNEEGGFENKVNNNN